MHGWLLSFGYEASNFDQDHVDAFRRHLMYFLYLNRPKASNVEMPKVKVEDVESIAPEDGVASKVTISHEKDGGMKWFLSLKDIPSGYQFIREDLTGKYWAIQTGSTDPPTSKNSSVDLSKDDSETNDAILENKSTSVILSSSPKVVDTSSTSLSTSHMKKVCQKISNKSLLSSTRKVTQVKNIVTKKFNRQKTTLFNYYDKIKVKEPIVVPTTTLVDDVDDFPFSSPEEVVKRLVEKHKYFCYLPGQYNLQVPLMENEDLSVQYVNGVILQINNRIFSTESSGNDNFDETSFVVFSNKIKDLSIEHSLNLEFYAVVNSRMLLHAAYCYSPMNESHDHIKYCTYLILLVRNLYFLRFDKITSSTKNFLVGLGLQNNYMKLKKQGCAKEISNYFISQTGYNGRTNLEHVHIWIHWLVEECTISLMHVDSKQRSTTLYVPNLNIVEDCKREMLIADVNKFMEYSLNSDYGVCNLKEACNKDFNLVSPLESSNYMFYVSICMVNEDLFTSHKFNKLKNRIKEHDPSLCRRGIVDMLCSTIIDNSGDNENHIVSIKEIFNKYCDKLDGEDGKHLLVRKINLAICFMLYVVSVSMQSRHVLEYDAVVKTLKKKSTEIQLLQGNS